MQKRHTEKRIGNWIGTWTGKKFWPLDPRPEEVFIEDIAKSLSNTCRYNGHCDFYSVAEHSVHISNHCHNSFALYGLLHDASEAYTGDIISPIKSDLVGFKEIEFKISQVIYERFGVLNDYFVCKNILNQIDKSIRVNEKLSILKHNIEEWRDSYPGISNLKIKKWPPKIAELEFLKRFYELTKPKKL